MSQVLEPIEGPVLDEPLAPGAVEVPRLARHEITLSDGHTVGVTVAGRGVPLVVVHGFSAEGFLYAQSLSRLVAMGFRVIAIDTAGHGATQGLPLAGHDINDYADLLGRCIDELGIERFVLAGHSMGGQLITRLAATLAGAHHGRDPDRRDRRRHLGPDGVPVPGGAAAAGRDRQHPAGGLRHDRPGLQRSPPGGQAAPAGGAHAGRPRRAALAPARSDDVHPADPVQPLRPQRPARGRGAGVRAARGMGPGRAPPHRGGRGPPHGGHARHRGPGRALVAPAGPRDAAGHHGRAAGDGAGRRHPDAPSVPPACARSSPRSRTSSGSATSRTPGCSSWPPRDSRTKVVGRHRAPKYRWRVERPAS